MSQVKETRNERAVVFNQQELNDLVEVVAQQAAINKDNPTVWYWISLGQRLSAKIEQ